MIQRMILSLLIACFDPLPVPAEQCALATTLKMHTDDGATIALHHHPGSGRPVLLVHGVSSNHRFWDLDADHSLALWLVAQDHDVWMLDLRGHGAALDDLAGDRQMYGWTIDDYGKHDVATAVTWIQSVTGAPKIDYIGHSLGGMVGAIYALTGGQDNLATFVALGSPAEFDAEDPFHQLGQTMLSGGGAGLLWVESPAFSALAADLGGHIPGRPQEILYNPDNFAAPTVDRMLRAIVSPMSRNEMAHLGQMLRHARFESADGSVDYRAGLANLRVPTLAIGGAGDHVVPAARVRPYATAVSGDAKWLEAGRASGMDADYGHLDLGLAERAPNEIFPVIAAWLDDHP